MARPKRKQRRQRDPQAIGRATAVLLSELLEEETLDWLCSTIITVGQAFNSTIPGSNLPKFHATKIPRKNSGSKKPKNSEN